MSVRPPHAPLVQFPVVDDVLQVGGMPLTQLAERIGGTPFYAYDRAALSERVALLRRHLPPSIHLHYAMKANPMPALVQHMATLVDGIDIAAGATVSLQPGGYHLMLTGLKSPLTAGMHFPLTLTFAKAGRVTVDAVVEAPGAAR